jgi:DNA-binding NarL/FixJ family response regulator
MWVRIRAAIIEDEPLAAQYLAALLDDTCQVEVVASATESEAGLRLCAELRPDAVFVDINLPGKDGVSLAKQFDRIHLAKRTAVSDRLLRCAKGHAEVTPV